MTATINILQNKFGGSKNLPIFVMSSPKTIILIFAVAAIFYAPYSAQAGNYGYQIPANCCTAKSVIVFGETGGDSLSCIHTTNFHSRMPKTMENLKKTAQGASCSTANTRKRVTRTSTKRTSKTAAQPATKLYQICAHIIATYGCGSDTERRCEIIRTDIYQATSELEAVGLAVASNTEKYGKSYKDIDLRSIKVTQRYTLPNF